MRSPRCVARVLAAVAVILTACTAHLPAENASRLRSPKPDPDAAACASGDARACGRRGARALTGEGVPQDDRDAATFLLFACEVGDPQSCADLGALYAAGRGVRRDDRRACALGLADACGRIGAPAPAVPREPSVTVAPEVDALEPVEELDAAALGAALRHAELYVPASKHEPLGLTREALTDVPPIADEDLPFVSRLVAARRPEVEACLPAIGEDFLEERQIARREQATFVVSADGRSRDVRTTVEENAAAAKCLEEAIARWEFPCLVHGGRVLFTLEPKGAPGPDVKGRCDPSCRAPREKEPGCVRNTVRMPRDLQGGASTRPMRLRFAVGRDGSTTDVHLLGAVPPALGRALRDAVGACAWEPGADGAGKPIPAWVVLPFRFEAGD
jgi:hypothetical protein